MDGKNGVPTAVRKVEQMKEIPEFSVERMAANVGRAAQTIHWERLHP
jgi:hypothetical protein